MSDLRFSFPACVIAGKGQITPDDVGLMQRQMWPEGISSRQQAAMAIALDDCCVIRCPEWTAYLVDAVAAFVVWRQPTPGTVSGETAGWLLEQLADQGVVRSQAGLDILVRVLDLADKVPAFLSAVTLGQVRLALLAEPQGAYAFRRVGGSGVTKFDLAFIWRVLRGAVDRGCVQLSRGERLVLQAIDGLASPADHHPAWREMMALTKQPKQPDGASAEAWLRFLPEKTKRARYAA
jgi:hypothetical protein